MFPIMWATHPRVGGSRAAGAAALHFHDLRVSQGLMSDCPRVKAATAQAALIFVGYAPGVFPDPRFPAVAPTHLAVGPESGA